MAETNFYLELLNKQITKLNKIISSKDKYPQNVYNCILAGILIQINSVVESCMLDFHSENFSQVASAIYSARQLIVHYSDYRAFDDIESISKDIIEKFNASYKSEKEYFDTVLSFQTTNEHNVVIKKSKDVVYDEFSKAYVFSKDGVEIAISASKVTVIKDMRKRKEVAYIVNCDSDMNCFYVNQNYETEYVQLKAPDELQNFFVSEFKPIAINYLEHKKMIKDMIDNFYSGSFSSIKTYNVPEGRNEKEYYIDTSKLLSEFFVNGVVYRDFLKNRAYKNLGAPVVKYEDFPSIRGEVSDTLLENISERDYFFIKKGEAMMNNINEELRKNASSLDEELLNKMQISMLINFVDQSVKNLSHDFIFSSPEFEKLHMRLLDYRNFFAHNIYQLKPNLGTRILEEFVELARGYIWIVSSLNIEHITKPLEKQERSFLAVERNPVNFINSKYEQYVKVDPHTYIGNKLYYSTRGSEYEKIIGLVPTDKHGELHGVFYEKKDDEFVPKTLTTKGGKKRPVMVTNTNYSKGEDLLMDVNLRDLLYINAVFSHRAGDEKMKKLIRKTNRKIVVFKESEDNNYISHAASLNHLISNYFQQRYLPYELARRTTIRFATTQDEQGYFQILDIDGNVIADVVDEKLFRKYDMVKDSNQVFSVTDIPYDFSITKEIRK